MKDFISCPNVKICHFEDQEIDFLGLMPKSAAEAVDGARVRSECLPGYSSVPINRVGTINFFRKNVSLHALIATLHDYGF